MTAIAFGGRLGLEWVGLLVSNMESPGIAARMGEIVALMLVVIAIYLVVTIDWNQPAIGDSG